MTREEWEKVVDHIVYKEEDSMVVLNARKKLFMRLYDDYVRDKKENERDNGKWIFHSSNPCYSPFDGSPPVFYRCINCGYITGNRTKYCPECGNKMN